jgi:hypothetical protein
MSCIVPVTKTLRSARTAMRSHMACSVSRSCVTRKTVRPSDRLSPRISCRNPPRRSGRGRRWARRGTRSRDRASARASPARLRMPPDSSEGYLSPAIAGRPTMAIFKSARDRAMPGSRPGTAHRHLDILAHRQRGKQRAVLEHHAPAGLDRGALLGCRVACRCPRRGPRPRPACSPAMVRKSTDLPVPEPPTTPRISPR